MQLPGVLGIAIVFFMSLKLGMGSLAHCHSATFIMSLMFRLSSLNVSVLTYLLFSHLCAASTVY